MRSRSHIILHGRRLRLSPVQESRLTTLLAHSGHLVSDRALHPVSSASGSGSDAQLAKAISRLRQLIRPHGYAIYRVVGRGFVLLAEQEREEGQR
jgi:DNA-binding response OmpR family regulator